MRTPRRGVTYAVLAVLIVLVLLALLRGVQGSSAQNRESGALLQAAINYKNHSNDKPSTLSSDGGQKAVINGDGTAVIWYDGNGGQYQTTVGSSAEALKIFQDNGYTNFRNESSSGSNLILQLLPNLVIFGLMALFLVWIFRQTQSGNNQAMSFGRSRARLLTGDKPAITFADVAGVEEAKTELSEIVEFLKYPDKFTAVGARIPKGVLLVGPPGTGKTLLSKAVAGEAGVPFFSISGSEFVEMFVGVGASRVRDLFDQAKKNAPCIVFVDEIDAVGRQRGAGLGGGHDEREQTLNQLLVEMDGFETATHVIVIAATNRPDVLDPALLRPGRFDRHVMLDRADIRGRRAILEVHARNKPLDPSVDLEVLAKQTPGFSGADLANLINEGAILAARNNRKVIVMADLEEAIARVIAGPERKSRVILENEKRTIAFHEMGHAMVGMLLEHTDPVHKISVVSRGMALGWTLSLPSEDKYLVSKAELEDQLAQILGGRCAEELILGESNITTGASDDIRKATQLARRMVTEWGMSDKLGPLTFGTKEELVFLGRDLGEQRNYSEDIASEIDQEVHHLVETAFQKAKEVLRPREHILRALATRLIEVETMEATEMKQIIAKMDGNAPPAPPAVAGPPPEAAAGA
ncbi:MAG: ATP-dependent zinc metalloprotease FtsH [Candidatus Dormibacteraeota bacterium]|uniref:ATP-dependent zinc metalloprotease FtsH n=1 Tax=Candidatus Amunia macphersoniae TaxID=3127014 RepID=A0A934KP12_9BACT|nr:ATP-dependent zinc metalloprotease FtsH [Candidatus Dormibacteraeota bacterium]